MFLKIDHAKRAMASENGMGKSATVAVVVVNAL
jgi:hypothetical protein